MISLVVSFHKIRSGAFKYLLPPKTISISPIISRLSKFTTGEMNASGFKVLSEGYSYPMSLNLIFLILPIDVDIATKFVSDPSMLLTSSNFGSFLKLKPSETILTLPIDPLIAVDDFVEYSIFSVKFLS